MGIVCLAKGYEKLIIIKEAYQTLNQNNSAIIKMWVVNRSVVERQILQDLKALFLKILFGA